jgi:hypothetical protein
LRVDFQKSLPPLWLFSAGLSPSQTRRYSRTPERVWGCLGRRPLIWPSLPT